MTSPRIGIVLPAREFLSTQRSGAVGLCMRDFTAYSRFRASTLIMGASPCDIADVPYHHMTDWQRWYLRDRIAYGQAAIRLARQHSFDLLEIQNRPTLLMQLRKALPKLGLTLHLHNDPQGMEGSKSIAQRHTLLAAAQAIYCVSDYVRNQFIEGVNHGHEKVHTIHNGMDIARLPAPQKKEKIVFFAGQIMPHKGIIEVIKAFRIAAPQIPDWNLVIAGDDKRGLFNAPSELAEDIAMLGSRFRHMGMLGHHDVMAWFAKAEISVVPTLTPEPLGRTAQEAMACGSALITSGSGGMKEAVGDAGLMIQPISPQSLADAMIALATDHPRRHALQTHGAKRMAELFDIKHMARALDDIRANIMTEHVKDMR